MLLSTLFIFFLFFFFNDTATTEIYTLSLHDALPILHGPLAALLLGSGLVGLRRAGGEAVDRALHDLCARPASLAVGVRRTPLRDAGTVGSGVRSPARRRGGMARCRRAHAGPHRQRRHRRHARRSGGGGCALLPLVPAVGGTVGQGVQLVRGWLRGAGSRSPGNVRPGGPPQPRVLGPPTVGGGSRQRGGDALDPPAGIPAPVLGSPRLGPDRNGGVARGASVGAALTFDHFRQELDLCPKARSAGWTRWLK